MNITIMLAIRARISELDNLIGAALDRGDISEAKRLTEVRFEIANHV